MAAVDPLCLCGIRGCVLAAQHATAFIAVEPKWRRRGTRKRHRRR
jgi:hypothetical protein